MVHRALSLNAAKVILAHNHPSGDGKPSSSDEAVTLLLMKALHLFEITILDHWVIAGDSVTSFAESGLIHRMEEIVNAGHKL